MTTTSNIHVGLSAWSNHTFILGERCSTGGNAYQCITPGTSTVAPTGNSADVDNGGTAHFKWLSAIDYTTLQAWSDGILATLTQPVIGLIWNDGIIQCTLGTILLNLGGHVTTPTNTITLTCAPGESIRDQPQATTSLITDSTKGVTIRGATSGGPTTVSYIWITADNVTVSGIQFIDIYAGSLSQLMIVWNTNCRIQGCIFDGYSSITASTHLVNMITGAAFVIENCLFIDRAVSNPYRCINCADSGTTNGMIVNCTLISSSTSGEAINGATSVTNGVVVKNCAMFGQTNAVAGSTALGIGVDYSVMSSVAGFGGFATDNGNNLFSKTLANQFISTTVDFREKLGADCINAGITDVTDIPLANDIFRTPRPQGLAWDVGCFEFGFIVSGGPSAILGIGILGSMVLGTTGTISGGNNLVLDPQMIAMLIL